MSLRVYISVDMEGISGVFARDETFKKEGELYSRACKRMAEDVNAAIEGALSVGARKIYAKDAHWNAYNIRPEELKEEATLVRGWGPMMSMIDGIEEHFDALLLIGYHSKAGTEDGILSHTYTGVIEELKVNGTVFGETGLNALLAGHFNTPVVFISGDESVVKEAKKLLGDIEAVVVKRGWTRTAGKGLAPKVAQRKIREGVERALNSLNRFHPLKLDRPLAIEVTFKEKRFAYLCTFIPGVKGKGAKKIMYKARNALEFWKIFNVMMLASWSLK